MSTEVMTVFLNFLYGISKVWIIVISSSKKERGFYLLFL